MASVSLLLLTAIGAFTDSLMLGNHPKRSADDGPHRHRGAPPHPLLFLLALTVLDFGLSLNQHFLDTSFQIKTEMMQRSHLPPNYMSHGSFPKTERRKENIGYQYGYHVRDRNVDC